MTTGLFKDKKILVTGGTGSIGSAIVRMLKDYDPLVIRVFDQDENGISQIQRDGCYRPIIGDVRNYKKLERAMEDIDIVFHCAALKHVDLCEYNTDDAIDTNIQGVRNIRDAAFYNNVERVINISTDKAVYPVSLMGMTKAISERIITNANEGKGNKRTIFSSVRFGNVLLSRGSVVLKWRRQILNDEPINVTDPDMTRYMMSIEDAVRLVFKAAEQMKGGEIFILKMPKIKLPDLEYEVVGDFVVEHKITGSRPGEKKDEMLMTREEQARAIEKEDMWVIPGVL